MSTIEVSYCTGEFTPETPHPCDPPPPCDPYEEQVGPCPQPYICFERLKNPEMGPTRCKPGKYINVFSCAKREEEEFQHPCDPLPPCSTMKKKRPCKIPSLCYHRIKNPEIPKRPITSDCNPDL